MAGMLITISSFVNMVQQMRSVGCKSDDGYAAAALQRAVKSGMDLARQCLASD